jgi:integrase
MRNLETIKYFTDAELNAFFNVLEKKVRKAETDYSKKIAVRNNAMFKVAYYCALRASETSLIKRDSYDNYRKDIYCKRLKGGKSNTLSIIDEDILEALEYHIKLNAPKDFLFTNFKTSNALSRKTIFVIFQKTCKAAKINNEDKWHPHTLRHTRAVDLADSGLDLKDLQFWLGHKFVENTMIYFQFTSKQQFEMYQKIKKAQRRKRKGDK